MLLQMMQDEMMATMVDMLNPGGTSGVNLGGSGRGEGCVRVQIHAHLGPQDTSQRLVEGKVQQKNPWVQEQQAPT